MQVCEIGAVLKRSNPDLVFQGQFENGQKLDAGLRKRSTGFGHLVLAKIESLAQRILALKSVSILAARPSIFGPAPDWCKLFVCNILMLAERVCAVRAQLLGQAREFPGPDLGSPASESGSVAELTWKWPGFVLGLAGIWLVRCPVSAQGLEKIGSDFFKIWAWKIPFSGAGWN